MRKEILSLDFDGVCHQYTTKWSGATVISDHHVEGLFEFLEEAQKYFDVQIYSTRNESPEAAQAMMAWFVKEHELWQAATGKPPIPLELGFPTSKPKAFVGLDDRIITFEGTWPDIEVLRNFKPWNKRDK
jgi:hypothetical protein